MKDFLEYVESSCEGMENTPAFHKYKMQVIDEITDRANEITSRGLKDENVLYDLIISEYPDLKNVFKSYAEKEKQQRHTKFMIKLNIVGSVLFLVLLFSSYFAISAITHRWDLTWLIIVGGVFALTIYGFSFAIKKLCKMSRIYSTIARALTGICIMIVSVFAFLVCLMFHIFPNSWVLVLLGVIISFVADSIFAYKTNQKFRIINYLLYIPASSALLYVILGALSVVSWSMGWLLIILGVLIDVFVMMGAIVKNIKYKKEEEDADEWNEN